MLFRVLYVCNFVSIDFTDICCITPLPLPFTSETILMNTCMYPQTDEFFKTCWYDQLIESQHRPLTRYGNLRVAHAVGIPGTFSPPPTSRKTASKRSRHAAWHVRLTCRDASGDREPAVAGKTFPVFLAHAQPTILRIWQEAHENRVQTSWHINCTWCV